MKKLTFKNATIDILTQKKENLTLPKCLTGVLTLGEKGMRFEEAVRRARTKPNVKLYDGDYCSLVHMQNGKYQVHMKHIYASGIIDRNFLAFNIYYELLEAFKIID